MTHRDRVGDPPGRRDAAGDVGHRQGFPTPSGGSPTRPERRLPKAFGRRRARLAMPPIATPRAPSRKPWEAVSRGHYRRSLVLDERRQMGAVLFSRAKSKPFLFQRPFEVGLSAPRRHQPVGKFFR